MTIAIQGKQEETVFGQYKFTSFSKVETPEFIQLSGCVKMNDWLCFNGSITLLGNMTGDSIILEDFVGSYVEYHEDTAFWLGRFMAKNNIVMPIMPLGELVLYNDNADASGESFRVKAVNTATTIISKFIELRDPVVSLYPNRIEMDINKFVTKLDEEYQLFSGDKEKVSSAFEFEHSEKVVVTGENVGLNIHFSGNDAEDSYHALNVGSMPFRVNTKNVEFDLDSINGVVDIKYIAKLAYLDMNGAGFSIKYEKSDDCSKINLSEVGFYVDKDVDFVIQGIPCSLSDFGLEIADIDKGNITNWVWRGKTDVNAGVVSDVLPGLEEYFGEVSVVTLENASISGRIKEPYLSFKTNFKLFEEFDLGELTLDLGNISYSNTFLGMSSEKVKGFCGEYTNKMNWNTAHCNVSLNGLAQIAVNNKVVGLTESGNGEIELHWWLGKKKFSSQGNIFIGTYVDHDGVLNFALKANEKKKKLKKTVNEVFTIYWNKNSGLKYQKQKLTL